MNKKSLEKEILPTTFHQMNAYNTAGVAFYQMNISNTGWACL